MKSFLIAALTVGATIAGLILYAEQKYKRKAGMRNAVGDGHSLMHNNSAEPLAIQSIP